MRTVGLARHAVCTNIEAQLGPTRAFLNLSKDYKMTTVEVEPVRLLGLLVSQSHQQLQFYRLCQFQM